jgi:hypothetical protein
MHRCVKKHVLFHNPSLKINQSEIMINHKSTRTQGICEQILVMLLQYFYLCCSYSYLCNEFLCKLGLN